MSENDEAILSGQMMGLANKNVEQLRFTGDNLRMNFPNQLQTRPRPGSRPDGGMATPTQPGWLKQTQELTQQILDNENQLRANLVDARNIIDNFERDMAKLESEMATLKINLEAEQARAHKYESMVRRIAELVVNGVKDD